jgi:Arc/MetJ-type ribon-helix-helix transcriptional regulator
MANTRKVTVTLPTDIADYLSQRAESGTIESVSSYVAEAVGRKVHRDRDRAQLEKALGGPPPQWATDLVHERMSARQGHAGSAE